MATLFIIRGISGSGKTTLARQLVSHMMAHAYFEADMFMVNANGEHEWAPHKLSWAHKECYKRITNMLNQNKSVILSNTSLRYREVENYLTFCKENNHGVMIYTTSGEYGSVHNVPDHTMQNQRKRLMNESDWVKQYQSVEF